MATVCDLIDDRRRTRPARGATFVVGIAGSVAVGKSTTAQMLTSVLTAGPDHPAVVRVSTDGFLYPNQVLARRGLLHRKGFPESYDRRRLLSFLSEVRSGASGVLAPCYDHRTYDVLDGATQRVDRPEVLLLEGLNVLQPGAGPTVSDHLDLSIYVDADADDIRRWYVERFVTLTRAATGDPGSFFAQWSALGEDELIGFADAVWTHVNAVNLAEHILPTRARADVIIRKGADHRVIDVQIRCGG